MTQTIVTTQQYQDNIMLFYIDEIEENMLAYKLDKDLYKHKIIALAQATFEFIYMPPYQSRYSLRSAGSLSIIDLGPSMNMIIHQLQKIQNHRP